MSNILTAPILPVSGQQPASAGTIGAKPLDPATLGSSDFKTQFDSVVASLTGNAPASDSKLDALQSALQKKIADMLAKGLKLTDIVQQLATTLANEFASVFGGDPAQLRAQLQSAFVTALSPPGTGPPLSIAESASALAQRFRQVAEIAARVSGETGQSNRLFAGSNSDAAITAGAAPAPTTNGPGLPTADSILNAVSTANLTTSPGDGKTVAGSASNIGSNGDTPIGRLLARALNSLGATPDASAPAVLPSASAISLVDRTSVAAALIAATKSDASSAPQTAPAAGAAITPAVNAFLRSFTSAVAAADGAPVTNATKVTASEDGVSSLIAPALASSNAPTVSAFMPVQAPFAIDASNANPTQSALPTAGPPVDPNSIVDQVVRGAFLRTDGINSEVRLKLVPENLGDLSVKLTVNGGSVNAQITAQTPDARDALLAGQAQLTRTLADAGLKLQSFNVDLAGGFASFQQQQQQSSGNPRSTGRRMLIDGVDTIDENDSSLLAVPSFGPPLLANANFGLLNYLA
jgi:flagellar hook-length control protein FliK